MKIDTRPRKDPKVVPVYIVPIVVSIIFAILSVAFSLTFLSRHNARKAEYLENKDTVSRLETQLKSLNETVRSNRTNVDTKSIGDNISANAKKLDARVQAVIDAQTAYGGVDPVDTAAIHDAADTLKDAYHLSRNDNGGTRSSWDMQFGNHSASMDWYRLSTATSYNEDIPVLLYGTHDGMTVDGFVTGIYKSSTDAFTSNILYITDDGVELSNKAVTEDDDPEGRALAEGGDSDGN